LVAFEAVVVELPVLMNRKSASGKGCVHAGTQALRARGHNLKAARSLTGDNTRRGVLLESAGGIEAFLAFSAT
jgi:hypothetical protein